MGRHRKLGHVIHLRLINELIGLSMLQLIEQPPRQLAIAKLLKVELSSHLSHHVLLHVQKAVFTIIPFHQQRPFDLLPFVQKFMLVELEERGVQPELFLLHLLTLASKLHIFILVARMRFLLLVQIRSQKGLVQLVCYQT